MLVRVLARVPEGFRGQRVTRAKLAFWDSSISALARSIKHLAGEAVELEFEISDMKIEYITVGMRFDIFLAVDERGEGYAIRKWMAATPIKAETLR